MNLDKQLKGRGVETIIIPPNITSTYTRLEVLLEWKLSGHTDTLTEASNLNEVKYKINNKIEMLLINLKYT